MIYYVNSSAGTPGDGTKENPFSTIQKAADLAQPGDEVIVLPGIYREDVDPKHAGRPDARITYRSLKPLSAVITGAGPLGNWTPEGNGVWTSRVPNTLFGEFNPYTALVSGDWFNGTLTQHLGDIFLNDKSMYEVQDPEQVRHPEISLSSWDPEFSVYTWICRQDAQTDETVFLANFHEKDPNLENVEITLRRHCFYQQKEQIGYITFSGFTVCKACPQWAPPTAYQEGMIGPHWSKGWIIEDCEIFEAKCSGISLGKYLQPENDNKWLKWKYKDGTQTERDCIMQAVNEGWSKETVGSHIVRRCNIHDCGQTGIVGHLGGVFSLIEDNHIHHINNKQNLAGAEIGGIKMHAAIDCIFRRNHIHHCTRGIWLDWQAQGTRVTQNFMHHNTLPNLKDTVQYTKESKKSFFSGLGEEVIGVGDDKLIQGVGRRHHERGADPVPPPGAARLLPGAGNGAGIAAEHAGLQGPDVNTQLQRVGADHRLDVAVPQALLDLPAFGGQIAAPVAAHLTAVADGIGDQFFELPCHDFHLQAALGKHDALHAVVHQHGGDFPRFGQHALADAQLPVDHRGIIKDVMLFSRRRAVVVDQAHGTADQRFGQFLGILNRGAAQNKLGMAAVKFTQTKKPPKHSKRRAARTL